MTKVERENKLILDLTKSLALTQNLIRLAELDGFTIPNDKAEGLHESHIQFQIAKNHLYMSGITLGD